MDVNVSREISDTLDAAATLSVQRGHFFVGVEHLFEALLNRPHQLPPSFIDTFADILRLTARRLQETQWRGAIPPTSGDVYYTPRCANAANEATKLAHRINRSEAKAGHLLLALLSDAHSAPSRAMDEMHIDRGAVLAALRKAMMDGRSPAVAAQSVAVGEGAPSASPAGEGDPLAGLLRDLTAEARAGRMGPAIGRDAEIMEIIQVLARKGKANVILAGEAGVGKTKIVEGLARMVAKSSAVTLMAGERVLELNLGALMSGTQYRGALEEKLGKLIETLKQSPGAILFIAEIHLIMGAGKTDGDTVDLANLLKPALARGDFKCIGATTLHEYRKFVERDPAVERRFQLVRIQPLSEEATKAVLHGLRSSLEAHHQIGISDKAIDASIRLTQRYMPNRQLPDKAIDVLDQACARYRLKALTGHRSKRRDAQIDMPRVTPHDIRKVVSQLTAIPIDELTADERRSMNNLAHILRKRIIGQDEAVAKVVAAVQKSRAGLSDPHRPDAIMLFLGPTGVGKTQMAKELADIVFGSRNHLITFDMSEYTESHSVSRLLGSPPGYVGSDEDGRLVAAVKDNPFCILLFDEIEKAHRSIFDIFLPIFDEGRLKDNRGRTVDFKNSIIILTSNVGADTLYRSENGNSEQTILNALAKHFRPEFINRVDEFVPFYPLLFEDVRLILRHSIDELRKRLAEKNIGIRMYQRAYEFIAEKGYSPQFGARELRRAVDRHVINPISERILNREFVEGDMIDVMMDGDQLVFRKGEPHARETASA